MPENVLTCLSSRRPFQDGPVHSRPARQRGFCPSRRLQPASENSVAGDDPVNESDPSGRVGQLKTVWDLGPSYWIALEQAYIPFLNTDWQVAESWFGSTVARPLALRIGNGARAISQFGWYPAPGLPQRVTDWMVGWRRGPISSNYYFEVKSGYQSLSAGNNTQVRADTYIFSQGGYVEWDFYPNSHNVNYQTGSTPSSSALEQYQRGHTPVSLRTHPAGID